MGDLPATKERTGLTPAASALLRMSEDSRRTLAETRRQTAPWWLAAPGVFVKCAEVIAAPVRVFNMVVETAVALAVVAVAAVGFMVYDGSIPQEKVVAFLKPLGKKVIDTVQSSAAPAGASVAPADPESQATPR